MVKILPSLVALLLSVSGTTATSSPTSSAKVRGGSTKEASSSAVYWEEETPPPIVAAEDESNDDGSDTNTKATTSRPLFWTPRVFKNQRRRAPRKAKPTPHPMRTNLWKIQFTSRNRQIFQNRTMIIDFDGSHAVTDGHHSYCKLGDNSIGKWHMIPSGVLWRYYAGKRAGNDDNSSTSAGTTQLHFTAEIHLNPFGDHPRMLRGVVVRDRYV